MKPALARIRRSTLIMIGVWIAILVLYVLVRPAPPGDTNPVRFLPAQIAPTTVHTDPPRTSTPVTKTPTTTPAPAPTTTPEG